VAKQDVPVAAGVAWSERALRWLLLCATLVGLAAMHTLGHAGVSHGMAMSGDHAGPTAHAAPPIVPPHVHLAQPWSQGCVHLTGGYPTDSPPEGWSVCLAILATLAVVGLLRWLLRATGRHRAPAAPAQPVAVGPRAPPRPLFGIRLVDVSVLRT